MGASGPGQAGFSFLIGSQWGIQDFDKGGPPKKIWPCYARHDLIVTILYLHTHTHKIIAIFRGRGEGGVSR